MKWFVLAVIVLAVLALSAIVWAQCGCVPGDANGDGSCNGLDVGFMVNYFKGIGAAPPCVICPGVPGLPCGADVNGNCAFNGLDVTALVLYFKGMGAPPRVCAAC